LIQIATVLPTVPIGTAAPAVQFAQSSASTFALELGAMLVPTAKNAADADKAASPAAAPAVLQMPAEPGKELPEVADRSTQDDGSPQPEDAKSDDASTSQDPAFAWFAVTLPIVAEQIRSAIAAPSAKTVREQPVETGIAVPTPVTTQSGEEKVVGQSRAIPDAALPLEALEADPIMSPTDAKQSNAGFLAPAFDPRSPSPTALGAPAATSVIQPMMTQAASVLHPHVLTGDVTPITPGTVPNAPAQVAPADPRPEANSDIPQPPIAASLAAQVTALPSLHRSPRSESDEPILPSIAATAAAALPQVAATPDAQQGALDLRRQEWLGKMVDTIEAMRDAGPARETRIALSPDALGKVDISVRQDGDRVHVHFTAESQAARQILSDAQPRLTELAETRGVRLGQTSVDSGQTGANAQSGQRQPDAQRPHIPSAPIRARAEIQFTETEDRVA
jgi:flagellar hook-length control protein FliK